MTQDLDPIARMYLQEPNRVKKAVSFTVAVADLDVELRLNNITTEEFAAKVQALLIQNQFDRI